MARIPLSSRPRTRSDQLCECGCGEHTLINKDGKANRFLFSHNQHLNRGRALGSTNDDMPVHPVLQAFRDKQKRRA